MKTKPLLFILITVTFILVAVFLLQVAEQMRWMLAGACIMLMVGVVAIYFVYRKK